MVNNDVGVIGRFDSSSFLPLYHVTLKCSVSHFMIADETTVVLIELPAQVNSRSVLQDNDGLL